MLVRELMRFFSQHRTIYCYLCLSLWIFLLIAGKILFPPLPHLLATFAVNGIFVEYLSGMYKYMSNTNGFSSNAFKYARLTAHDEYARLRKLQPDCNPYQKIARKDDGGVLNGWKLHGVMMIVRHGDRGPMSHVRSINNIDCSGGRQVNPSLNKYRTFLLNATANAPAGHFVYNRNGPFHNFPLLPAFTKACLLGQLTYSGIAQLLQTGDILRQVYAHQLDLLRPLPIKSINSTQSQMPLYVDDILIYTTRYRRTFQSAMALMYGFLPERWQSLSPQESNSLAFCFSDCACARADHIKDMLAKEFANDLNQHPSIDAVVQWIGSNILQNPSPKMQALEVRDALLSLICHNAPLPCRRSSTDYNEATASELVMIQSTTESNDLINIDQDDGTGNRDAIFAQQKSSWQSNRLVEPDPDADGIEPALGCVEVNQVAAVMEYTQWQADKEAKHKLTQQQGLLRAYGLIRNIVTNMLKIISGDKLKFVLYSGHDRTIQFLFTALGLYRTDDQLNPNQPNLSYFIPYATRIAFELYKSEAGNGDLNEYYFRVVSNGHDVTNRIEFCEGGRSLRIVKDGRGNRADLCPVENIIRFIHDDYFNSMNATNQKEACSMLKNP